MNLRKSILVVLAVFFIPALVFAGSVYYVDCDAGSDGNGSYDRPWNSISSVNANNFRDGDDVYFKVNTTCVLRSNNDRLKVRWSGVNEADRVIIGAYYGQGKFGLNGNRRPIIDGDSKYPESYLGAIHIVDESYITVKDIQIQYNGSKNASGTSSIIAKYSDHINIENVYSYRSHGGCFTYGSVDIGVIKNNICENAGYPDYQGNGAAIEISGMDDAGATTDITVSHNVVENGKNEGIGFYRKASNCVAEYNVIRDMKSFHLYADSSKDITFRYNLIYESTERANSNFSQSEYGIAMPMKGPGSTVIAEILKYTTIL